MYAVRAALARILEATRSVRRVMGDAARERVERELSYDRLVERLLPLTRGDFAVLDGTG